MGKEFACARCVKRAFLKNTGESAHQGSGKGARESKSGCGNCGANDNFARHKHIGCAVESGRSAKFGGKKGAGRIASSGKTADLRPSVRGVACVAGAE